MNKTQIIVMALMVFWMIWRTNNLEDKIKELRLKIEQFTKNLNGGDYFVRLESIDEEKTIQVIKAIKEIANYDLREAKNLVDPVRLGSMSIIIKNVNIEYATMFKESLERIGCKVAIVHK